MTKNPQANPLEDHTFYMALALAVEKEKEAPQPAPHSTRARLFNEVTDALERYEAIHWPMGDIPEEIAGANDH